MFPVAGDDAASEMRVQLFAIGGITNLYLEVNCLYRRVTSFSSKMFESVLFYLNFLKSLLGVYEVSLSLFCREVL